MKKLLQNSVVFILLLVSSAIVFSQTLRLGVLSDFEAYTGVGAVTNSGIFTGDVGTSSGVISGFIPPNFTGTIQNSNVLTDQAKIDILRLYIHLNDIFVDYPGTHLAAFGGGETILPGVYSIPSAGSVGGTVTLDGGGDSNAVFIIKFLGAMTVGASSTVILSNQTRACNVFWITEGAATVGAGSVMKGSLFSHGAAITLAVNCNIEGRMLTTGGAITIGAACVAIAPAGLISVPISPVCECSPASDVDVLGSLENHTLFTSSGAVTNLASSGIIGDIGSDVGAITGFGTSTHIGSLNTPGVITAQAKLDLDSAYIKLMALPNSVTGHAPAFGFGETLMAGVYFIGVAGSLSGTITLDGQNNPDAIFVFKFAGAFSITAQSKVIFTNGTNRCNVFWIAGAGVATGAITVGANSSFKGTLLAHAGACNSGVGGFIEGRMLSTAGAVGFSTGVIYNDPLCFDPTGLPIDLVSFTVKEVGGKYFRLNWVTVTENNNDYFNIERSADAINFESIKTINGAGNSVQVLNYSTIDDMPLNGMAYYRLKQTDYNGETSYSTVKALKFNRRDDFVFEIYPNPFSVQTTFQTTEVLKNASIIVYNSNGQVVKEIKNISGKKVNLDRENLSNGLYFINLVQDSQVMASSKLVVNG